MFVVLMEVFAHRLDLTGQCLRAAPVGTKVDILSHCSISPDGPGPGSGHCYVHAETYSVFLLGLSLDYMSQAPLAV